MNKIKKLPACQMVMETMRNRRMLVKLAQNDFKTKYAGSYMGVLWAFVQPVITILLYWFVFQIGLRNSGVGDYPFVLFLTAGLVPWFYFNDAWNGATSSLLDYSFLVKKVVFDVGILPSIKVISAFFVNAFFTVFMVILFCFYGFFPGLHLLQILYCLVCITILSLGLGYLTSAIMVFVRDLGHLLTVVLQMLMWMTPIMWPVAMVEKSYPWLVNILKLNPVFYIVQCYRDAMFSEKWFWERPLWSLYFWVLTILLFILGSHTFQKMRSHFADVL